ncbi:type III toxin-antitoxin system ToxN/AbiQ family toxin [Ursidibacter sp. B-7004-1]
MYYIPLTSDKRNRYKNIPNGRATVHSFFNQDEYLGALLINNMIPLHSESKVSEKIVYNFNTVKLLRFLYSQSLFFYLPRISFSLPASYFFLVVLK